ncbi:MAG: CinA family protein [Pseudomonadales bacterium]|nr:CinA family protein [Pseudomonadales bacterium]
MNEITSLLVKTSEALLDQGLLMATAESCTGGWIAQQATSLAGSSDWFDCGFVSYSNAAKQSMLGVTTESLNREGAVSEAVVIEMVQGAIAASRAQVAVAVSGVAGPAGGSQAKPVGTVWIAWGKQEQRVIAKCFHFQGDREQVRWQTVVAAYQGLLALLQNKLSI